jgi:hypothetical protein
MMDFRDFECPCCPVESRKKSDPSVGTSEWGVIAFVRRLLCGCVGFGGMDHASSTTAFQHNRRISAALSVGMSVITMLRDGTIDHDLDLMPNADAWHDKSRCQAIGQETPVGV